MISLPCPSCVSLENQVCLHRWGWRSLRQSHLAINRRVIFHQPHNLTGSNTQHPVASYGLLLIPIEERMGSGDEPVNSGGMIWWWSGSSPWHHRFILKEGRGGKKTGNNNKYFNKISERSQKGKKSCNKFERNATSSTAASLSLSWLPPFPAPPLLLFSALRAKSAVCDSYVFIAASLIPFYSVSC